MSGAVRNAGVTPDSVSRSDSSRNCCCRSRGRLGLAAACECASGALACGAPHARSRNRSSTSLEDSAADPESPVRAPAARWALSTLIFHYPGARANGPGQLGALRHAGGISASRSLYADRDVPFPRTGLSAAARATSVGLGQQHFQEFASHAAAAWPPSAACRVSWSPPPRRRRLWRPARLGLARRPAQFLRNAPIPSPP